MVVSELSHGEKDKYHMNSLTSAVYRNKLIDAGHRLVFTRGKGASKVAIVIKNPPAREVDKRPGFDSWAGKIPWRRKWQLSPIFLPGKLHREKSLAGCSSWGFRASDKSEVTQHTHRGQGGWRVNKIGEGVNYTVMNRNQTCGGDRFLVSRDVKLQCYSPET